MKRRVAAPVYGPPPGGPWRWNGRAWICECAICQLRPLVKKGLLGGPMDGAEP